VSISDSDKILKYIEIYNFTKHDKKVLTTKWFEINTLFTQQLTGNGYENVDMFGLGRINLLHCCCCRARTGLATAKTLY